ncbi:MAG: hypothetical protein EXR71_03915 [Myxococcales bacterium]|nr:hypothetical protein [Myxococcales bacterium]
MPLLFEVFSSAETDHKSQNTIWLDAIDRLHAVAPRAVMVIDRARLCDNGKRSPYRCAYASMEVRLPNRPEPLWLCVFDREDHAVPLVVLTNPRADTRAASAAEAGPPARPVGHPCLTRAAPVVAASLPGQTRPIRSGAEGSAARWGNSRPPALDKPLTIL